jgi:hypothetical protein
MDITPVFGTDVGGSNPSGSTIASSPSMWLSRASATSVKKEEYMNGTSIGLLSRYHKADGTVLEIRHRKGITPEFDRYQALIRLDDPFDCVVHTTESAHHNLFRGLNARQRVACSWFSRNGGAPGVPGWELDARGIELADAWDRPARFHETDYEHDGPCNGMWAERDFIGHISRSNLRISEASPYEDQVLGIDIWAYLRDRKTGNWSWLPFDLTLQPLYKGDRAPSPKFKLAFHRRVIPYRMTATHNAEPNATAWRLIEWVDRFKETYPLFHPVSRGHARKKERKYNSNHHKKRRNSASARP